jgi:O-antigen ligase
MCILFINRPEYLLPTVLISSLLGDYFVAFSGIGMSRVTVLIYIFFSVIHMFKEKKGIAKSMILALFWVSAYCFMSAYTSLTGQVKPAVTMILNLTMMFSMANQFVNNRNVFITNLQYSIWVFCIYMIFAFLTGRGISYYANRLVITGTNSNALGMCMAIIIVFLLARSYTEANEKTSFWNICFAITSSIILCLTGSRSALIGATVSSVVMVMFMGKTGTWKKRITTLLLLGLLFYIGYKFLENYAPEILMRFTVESVESKGGTGRVDIWKAVIQNVIPYHVWFGVGLGGENTIQAMAPYVSSALGVHNMYITILMQTGIIGCVIFYCFWIKCLRTGVSYRRLDHFIDVPMLMCLSLFVNGIGEEVFDERFLWFAAGLIYLCVYNIENGNWSQEYET